MDVAAVCRRPSKLPHAETGARAHDGAVPRLDAGEPVAEEIFLSGSARSLVLGAVVRGAIDSITGDLGTT
jgi:hypothetical protein